MNIPSPVELNRTRLPMIVDLLVKDLRCRSPMTAKLSLNFAQLHLGLTSRDQFDILAEQFHAAGWNTKVQDLPARTTLAGDFLSRADVELTIEEP